MEEIEEQIKTLEEAGTSHSGDFTDDIDGDTRTAWDIGIDYIVGAGGATSWFFTSGG